MIVEKIKCDKCKKDLSDPWMTFCWKDGTQSHICKECTSRFNTWLNEPVEEEYPLTFEQALKEMLNGNIVQSEYNEYRFNREKSYFEWFNEDNVEWEPIEIFISEQTSKWRVVE